MKAGVKIAFWTDPGWAVALRDGVPMRGPDGESLLTYRVQLTTSETALAQEFVVTLADRRLWVPKLVSGEWELHRSDVAPLDDADAYLQLLRDGFVQRFDGRLWRAFTLS